MSVSGASDGEAHGPLVPSLADHGALAMDEAEFRDWGHKFGRAAHPPLLVTLSGDLGTGKTTLVQSICQGYGVTGRSSWTRSRGTRFSARGRWYWWNGPTARATVCRAGA